MNDKIIQAIELKKHFKGHEIKALDGVSLDIAKGEVVVIEESFGIRVTEIIK